MKLRESIKDLLFGALQASLLEASLPTDFTYDIEVEWTKDAEHGDLACNLAMIIAKPLKSDPRELAARLIKHIPSNEIIKRVQVAGPGFINIFLQPKVFLSVVGEVLTAGEQYGRSNQYAGQRFCVEYVSANPTGPLHVGHGRGAAYGATVSNLLSAIGFDVHREYYVNDAGRQMHILALSVWLRYLALDGEPISFPRNAYNGEYVIEIARQLHDRYGRDFYFSVDLVLNDMPPDGIASDNDRGDLAQAEKLARDAHVDALVARMQALLDDDSYQKIFSFSLRSIEDDIRRDLEEFGVSFNRWFHESELLKEGTLEESIDILRKEGHVYEEGGALWFRATQFGDEKDRVLIRADGRHTYFAADVAYHLHKYKQDYDYMLDIFGADHHGYVARIRAFLEALECDGSKLTILLVQFAILYRGKERVQMSTRGGQFVTLRQLRSEVGNDAARFFYITRRMEQHLDFDLELAKSHSNDNPVYYIQYAHARICSVFRQLYDMLPAWQHSSGLAHLDKLVSSHEKQLLRALLRYPEVVHQSAMHYEPHILAYYLQEVANIFHSYYNAHHFLIEDEDLRDARLCLVGSVRQVFSNALALLGVSAPDVM